MLAASPVAASRLINYSYHCYRQDLRPCRITIQSTPLICLRRAKDTRAIIGPSSRICLITLICSIGKNLLFALLLMCRFDFGCFYATHNNLY